MYSKRGTIYNSEDESHEKVELFISCRSLKNMDFLSKSDPVVILYVQNNHSKVFQEFGRTEMIKDNLNPNFVTSFQINFVFEEHQNLKFEVIDIDSETSFDLIGNAETTLGKIMGSKSQLLVLDVMDKGKKNGKLIIRGEKVVSSNEVLNAAVRCTKIPGQHWFHKTRPFLKFLKTREDNFHVLAHQTEHVSDLNPVFQPFKIPLGKLCNGDKVHPIIVEVWDYSDSGSHHLIGSGSFSISQLESGTKEIHLKKHKNNHSAGSLIFGQFSVVDKPSFVDFIRGGIQLNLISAIDFTASNGNPKNPSSLHYGNNMKKSQYQIALEEVGSILMNYDYDQMVPVYGFGGRPQYPHFSTTDTLHCFPLTGNPQNPEVPGLESIIRCYQDSLMYVDLNGPTLFAPLIYETMKLAQVSSFIIQDGEIHDMDSTKSAIVDSAFLPLSIIIIGIGDADFGNMEILDGDDGLIDSRGLSAKRDLVQFVPFNKYKGSGELLAKHVLAELPDQLIEYMTLINKPPNPPLHQDINQLQFSVAKSQANQIPSQGQNFGQEGNYQYPGQNEFKKTDTMGFGLEPHGF